MEVLAEVTLDKEVMVPDELRVMKKTWKTTNGVIEKDYFEQTEFFP